MQGVAAVNPKMATSNPTITTASLDRDWIEGARVLIKMMLLRYD
jgi:hypothetical protein